jgi:hypothetical protein
MFVLVFYLVALVSCFKSGVLSFVFRDSSSLLTTLALWTLVLDLGCCVAFGRYTFNELLPFKKKNRQPPNWPRQ